MQIGTVNRESTVGAFVVRYLKHAATIHRPGTLKSEQVATGQFAEFFDDVKISEVTPERADAWALDLREVFTQNTTRTRICVMKAVFEYARSLAVIDQNPFANIALPKMVFSGRIAPDKFIKAFFGEFPLRMRRCLKLILNTGMRKNEAVLLDWSEVVGNKIVLPPERTKNGKGRTIYLNAAARRALGHRPSSGTGRVYDFSPSYLNKYATRAWKKLGTGRFRIHDLRHCAATRHYEKNHDDYAMMQNFGWSNIESAQPYHHVTDERVRRSMTKLTYAI